jgi:SAM-dependent methyltransferase
MATGARKPASASPAAFYDPLAAEYEAMTHGAARLRAAERFCARLAARIPFRDALDLACGTGTYALALAARGLPVIGVDLSPAMVAAARARAQAAGLTAEWRVAPMQALGRAVDGHFDLILCMGNSIPHLLRPADLAATLRGCRQRLRPGGHLLLHLLNYARIVRRQERLVSIDREGDRAFIRFYDFLRTRLRFNLLTVDWARHTGQGTLRSVDLRACTASELTAAAVGQGLQEVQCWGGLDFSPFTLEESETLLLQARAPSERSAAP